MSRPTVTLTSYSTGFEDEADYDAWIAYVAAHIAEHVGFAVEVDACSFARPEFEDTVVDATPDQEASIREAVSYSLWDAGCGDNFDQPRAVPVPASERP